MNDELAPNRPSEVELRSWLIHWVANELELSAEVINSSQTFVSYNLNSVQATMLVGDLEDLLHCRLSPTLAWDYETIDALAHHLATSQLMESTSSTAQSDLPGSDPSQLLASLDQLSDDEVEALLSKYMAE